MDGSIRVLTRFDNSEAEHDAQDFIKMAKDACNEVERFSKDLGFGEISAEERKLITDSFKGIDSELRGYGKKLAKAVLDEEEFGKQFDSVMEKIKSGDYTPKDLDKADSLYEKWQKAIEAVQRYSQEVERGAQQHKQTQDRVADEIQGIRRANAEQKRFSALTSAAQKGMNALSKIGNKLKGAIGNGVTSLKRFALALVGIRALYAGAQQMAQQILANNEQMRAQLDGIKSAFATAFEPILQGIINSIVKVISYVNALIQALTGVNFIAKSNAKAIKGVGGAAKEAKNQLAGFDEMNVLSDNSSGGGGGGSTSVGLELDDVSKEKFFKDLKECIEKGDWYGVGAALAGKLNDAMDKINWPAIQEKVSNGAKGLADSINGFFSNFHWKDLGMSVAEAVNTLFTGIHDLIWETDWATVGDSVGDAIVGFIENLDYKKIWETVVGGLAAAVEFLLHLFDKIWPEVDKKLGEFEQWIGDTWKEWFGKAKEWVHNWIQEHIVEKWKEKVEEARNAFNEKVDLIKKKFDDFKIAISDKLAAIKQKFTDAWDKLKSGATNAIDGVKTAFNNLKEKISSIFDSVKTKISDAWNSMKAGASNAWAGVKNIFSSVASFFKDTFQNAWQKVKDVFSTGGKIFTGIKDGIVSAFKNIVNGIIGGINSAIAAPFNGINNALNAIRNITILGKQPFAGRIGTISVPSIPQLALGGVTAQPTFAQIGERGREAVLPLTNSSIMDDLGQSIAEHIGQFVGNLGSDMTAVIPIYLDSRKISEKTVKIQRQQGFVTNGGAW